MSQSENTITNPSIMCHVSIGTRRMQEACVFYDAVLAEVGARRIMDFEEAVAYGRQYPEFWVQMPFDGQPPSVGNGTHFAFMAANKEQVDAFYQAALAHGATGEGEPGPRPHYSEAYYGCFVRDLDGHKIEATFWDVEKAPM